MDETTCVGLLEEHGIKPTANRIVVLKALASSMLPQSLAELERRIKGRGSETPESLERRLGAARQEIAVGKKYTYVVVNTTVKMAVKRIQSILEAEHSRVERNDDLFEI